MHFDKGCSSRVSNPFADVAQLQGSLSLSGMAAGADRVLAMDLHSGQCIGYFDIPVDHVYGDSVILDYLASKRISTGDLVVVSPGAALAPA